MSARHNIYAVGKTGRFEPYTDRNGCYPLYSQAKRVSTGQPIHHAVNKEAIATLEEAIALIRAGTHYWRLHCPVSGQNNVFAPESIIIEPA
jgi:hypothetical protein